MLNGTPLLERTVSDRSQTHCAAPTASSPSKANAPRNATGETVSAASLLEELKKQKEWKNAIVFQEDKTILASTFTPKSVEVAYVDFPAFLSFLQPMHSAWTTLFSNREDTIASGIVLANEQYDVHRCVCSMLLPVANLIQRTVPRYHPPLIYGRRGDPLLEQTEGIAICKVERPFSQSVFCLITYSHPTVSARAVPQLREFCQTCTKFHDSYLTFL